MNRWIGTVTLLEEPVDLPTDSLEAIGRTVAQSGTALITTFGFVIGIGMRDQATDAFWHDPRPELAYVCPDRQRARLYDGHREYMPPSELPWYDGADARRIRAERPKRGFGGRLAFLAKPARLREEREVGRALEPEWR